MTLDLDSDWSKQPLVCIDFETLSLQVEDGVCEVAAVRFEGGRIVDSWSSFINPGRPIPPEATSIHRVTDDMVKGAPTLEGVAGDLLRLCKDAIPCAYMSTFDSGFLRASFKDASCPAFDVGHLWVDPLVIIRDVDKFVSGKGRHTLGKTCARWGVDLGVEHNALSDATACGQLLYALLDKGKILPCPLGKLLRWTAKRRLDQEADFAAYRAKKSSE